MSAALRLCFVCLGNICRSPSAEAVMRGLLHDAGLQERIEVDSAGTGGWHVGERADPRSGSRGVRLRAASAERARHSCVTCQSW